ncbi:hypothetical protein CHUAL_014192 [Chamberlinius hualienensis]
MSLMWYHRGNLKVPKEFVSEIGVYIGDKIYLLGLTTHVPGEEIGPCGIMVSKLDLKTMKIEKLMLIEEIHVIDDNVLTYGECIVIIDPIDDPQHIQFLIINTKTRKIEKHSIDHASDRRNVATACIVENHIYIVLESINPSATKVSILTVNLKTWKKEMVKRSNAPHVFFKHQPKAFVHGKDIFFISFEDSSVSIFNTEVKQWTKMEDFGQCKTQYRQIDCTAVYSQGEIFIFKVFSASCLENWTENWTDIFNCSSMQWRRETFSLSSIFRSGYFTNCFDVNGKIFILKNSDNAINHMELEDEELSLQSNIMDIYELDLNPSLGKLYAMNIVQQSLDLNWKKISKSMHDELKRYIR